MLVGQSEDRQLPSSTGGFEYEDCGCAVKIDLTIHNGLYGNYGGQAIPDADETTKGAVTVANLNDTDGDSVVDNQDPEVVSSSVGRDEVDLMRLDIISTGAVVPSCPDLELVLQGAVKLWKSSSKIASQSSIIPVASLPVTVWVEATQVSASVRDIIIQAVVAGDVKDEVKATAVWVEKKNVYTKTGIRISSPTPSSLGVDNPDFLSFINTYSTAADGSLYGFGTYRPIPGITPSTDGWFGGRILFEFELRPSGIEAELSNLGIKYDISRRIERNNEFLTYTAANVVKEVKPFPQQNEEGNDDSECFCPMGPSDRLDEDAIPKPMDNRLFSYDAPSEPAIGSARAFSLRRLLFEEFVRVSFGQDIVGNVQEGSQCSKDYDWNLSYLLASSSSLHPSDQYHPDYQLLVPANGGVIISNPRRLTGSGNGAIHIAPVTNSTVVTYLLEFSNSGDQWKLYEVVSGGRNLVDTSNISTSGPWDISYSTINVNIVNGSTSFSNGAVFAFNVANIPSTLQSMTAN